jgi:hypothetical protein
MGNSLPANYLDTARRMAADGARPQTIRHHLGITQYKWTELMRAPAPGEKSDLALAIADGEAAIVTECLGLLVQKMREGNLGAAKELLNRLGPKEQKDSANVGVFIQLNKAMTPEEYAEALRIEVEDATD